MLYAKGVFINKSFDALNLTSPELVGEVHQEYVRAGADIIETNTFGANRTEARDRSASATGCTRSTCRGRGSRARPLRPRLRRRLDRSARRPDRAVGKDRGRRGARRIRGTGAGARGRRRRSVHPGDVPRPQRDWRGHRRRPPGLGPADRRADDHRGRREHARRDAARAVRARPRATWRHHLGVNCAVGPAPMLDTIERMAAVTKLKLSAQPNAGRPRDVEGRNLYLCSPEYMASYARRFILHNVRVVGGCCGTTPEHIRQIKVAVRSVQGTGLRVRSETRPQRGVGGGRADHAAAAPAGRAATRPRHRGAAGPARGQITVRALARTGRFVVAVEVVAPRGVEYREAIAQASAAEDSRRGCDQHLRRPPHRRAHQRSVAGGADRAAGRHRNAAALRLSRSQPDRHPVRSARRACDGAAQPDAHHGRPGPCRRLPGCDRRVRRRLDRPDQPRVASQSRLRRRRSADRRAGAVSHRRVGESRRRRTSTRSCDGSSTKSRPGPSSW